MIVIGMPPTAPRQFLQLGVVVVDARLKNGSLGQVPERFAPEPRRLLVRFQFDRLGFRDGLLNNNRPGLDRFRFGPYPKRRTNASAALFRGLNCDIVHYALSKA